MIPRIRIEDDVIFYDIWRGIPASDLRAGEVLDYVKKDLFESRIKLKDIGNYSWIIDCDLEGHDEHDIEPLRQVLINQGVKRFGAIFSSYVDTDSLPYPAVCLPDRVIYAGNWFNNLQEQVATYEIDWKNLPMTQRLCCPMRRPSHTRAELAKRLFGILNPKQMVISLGTNEGWVSDEIKRIILPHPWPLMVDHPRTDNEQQHKFDHTMFYTAPMKIVVESSSDFDENVWRSQFITEKTYKAFSWYQLPLWYAVPGLVQRVREQGFDVFDDIINHQYDTWENPWQRMVQMLIELKRLLELDTVQLRQDLWDRLESNANLVNGIHNTAHSRHSVAIARLKNEVQQL